MTTTTTDTQPTPPETSGMGQLQSLLLQTIKDLRNGHTTPLPPGQHWQGLVHRTSDEEPTR